MTRDLRPILYTDLDDSLFQTLRKLREPPCEDRLAAIATNGHHSYMTEGQARLVAWMLDATEAIPVTARSTEALSRCRIAFTSWRIAANGAVILRPDGTPDPDWRARTCRVASDRADLLNVLVQAMAEIPEPARFRSWIVEEQGTPVYFCVKSNGDEADLDAITQMLTDCAGPGMLRHRNGNNLSFTPDEISKHAAVRYLDGLLAEQGPRVRLGMGDSLTDLPFMGLCDVMLVPPESQIHAALRGA